MKRHILTIAFIACTLSSLGQGYRITFGVANSSDSMLYLGQHFRDKVILLDSALRSTAGDYTFTGHRLRRHGIYTLVRQDRTTVLTDFLCDNNQRFSLKGDSTMRTRSIRVSGSKGNSLMYAYRAKIESARAEQDSLRKIGDEKALNRLNEKMQAYDAHTRLQGKNNLYFQLVEACDTPEVPDSVEDKGLYFRTHYWDGLIDTNAHGQSALRRLHEPLLYSPQLFNKMNYYFFGMLYRAPSDTIIAEIDRLMDRLDGDTAMQRYVMQFIEPRYYRATRNIGWDAVWCHLVGTYYLKGLCPWARESELYVMEKNYKRIKQSLIGVQGQELWMIDTTQIDAPEHWHSSHRQPTRYVILWFWDPDCHHCQEQSAQLKVLYDSLCAAGNKRFEVYAVGYESDVPKWKRYVREHDFRWVNVGGSAVNIDYQEAYNVHGAPTMIILDEHRNIIMNKVLPIKSLLSFLDTHEKHSTPRPPSRHSNNH